MNYWTPDQEVVDSILAHQIEIFAVLGTRDLFNISYSRELYLYSEFLHFEEIVRVKMAVCFEMIVSETKPTVQLFKNMSFVADFHSKVELLLS